MNIGSLIRGLLGDSKAVEPKSVELKEGQVVRGVVLSVSESGKEAVVQIQGTPVRAELETPLTPGQTLSLQVGSPSEGGLPVLKPVSLGEAALASPQSMGEAIESLGLANSKAGREIIQAIQSGGLALTKETAAKLDAVMNAKPPGVPTSEWLEAAVISVKRGLPVTAETVKGLQQAVFGPKLHQLVANLEAELNVWAQQGADSEGTDETAGMSKTPNGGLSSGTSASLTGATAGVQPGAMAEPEQSAGRIPGAAGNKAAVAAGDAEGQAATARSGAGTAGGNAAAANPVQVAGNAGLTGGQATGQAEQAGGQAAAAAQGTAAADGDQQAAAGQKLPVADAASGNKAAAMPPAVPEETAPAGAGAGAADGSGEPAGTGTAAGRTNVTAGAGPGAEAAQPQQSAPQPQNAAAASGPALLAKLQGVLTELRGSLPQLAAAPPASGAAGGAPAAAQPQGNSAPPPVQAGQEQVPAAPHGDTGAAPAAQDTESWVGRVLKLLGAEHEQQAVRGGGAAAALPGVSGGAEDAAGTLKGVLLQVLGASEVPPAVKDAAGQLVQQLTGQQLLLNTDRTAPFAQVTMFLPLRGPDGQETASVHIQSRRGKKGELDAANCRLWFDLDMKQLGQTMVDVQVVDRIVSLKLHNNEEWVQELLEGRREEIRTAVESIGYQLSSLRTEPLPELSTAAAAAKQSDYVPDSYKGVDFRI